MHLKHLMARTVPGAGLRRRPDLERWWTTWLAGALVATGALLLRLWGLGNKPYWLDEIITLRRSSLGLVALVRDSLMFHHLPLFFLLSAPFARVGLGPDVMRLPSALFGALSCLILFLCGRSVGGMHCGLAAALLLALSPLQVQYAQEARSYTLVTCFILLGLWGMVRLAGSPRHDRTAWLLYGLGTALALDTLSVALFWFCAAQVCALLIGRRSAPDGFAKRWLPVQAAILAAYLPLVAAMAWLTRGKLGSGLDWVPPASWQAIQVIARSVALMQNSSLIAFRIFPGPFDPWGVPWFGIGVLALGATGLWSRRRSLSGQVLLIAFAALPVGVALVSVRSSLWMPRYLLWSGPVLFLLAGIGVAELPRRAALLVLASIATIGLANLAPYYRTESKPLWNIAAATLHADWQPGDLVLTDDPATITMMNVATSPIAALADTPPPSGFRRTDWTTRPDRAIAAHRDGRRVWVLHGRVGQNDPYRLDALLDTVPGLGAPSTRNAIGLDIRLWRFDPSP